MNVPSLPFLCAVAAVALALAISRRSWWRSGVLCVANLAFFATFAQGPASLAPFVAFLGAGYVGVLIVERVKARWLFVALLATLVAGYCWLKQYAFFPHQTLLATAYVTVGLSYAFFRVLSVFIDTYQGALPVRAGILSYVNYTLNFTSFVSGPIQLYPPFRREETEAPAALDRSIAGTAVERIVTGFFKVTVLSPLLALAQQRVVDAAVPQAAFAARALDAAAILAIFPVYLYVNFSGYTDVVVGAARFLRFDLPENFNRPFLSRGYLEFWTRWHMSLANWFKTYVYSPLLLGLMRRFPARNVEAMLGVFAYFVTFFLVGLWHGRTPEFLILGLLMGLGTSGNKLFQLQMTRVLGRARYTALCDNPLYAALSSGLTFWWLALTLVFFWANGAQIAGLAQRLGPPALVAASLLVLLAAAAFYAVAAPAGRSRLAAATSASTILRPAYFAALAVIVVSVAVIFNAPSPHVVYKAF